MTENIISGILVILMWSAFTFSAASLLVMVWQDWREARKRGKL